MTTTNTTPTRRHVVGALAAGAAAAAGGNPALAQGAPKTFVLVHGAWHGGWCWRRVSDLLEKKGHKVFTPTMTGLGACSHLMSKDINITTHVTDIANLIRWEDLSGVVLVGHSYGGIIINGVAEQLTDKIGSIVFLDAFMPENGDVLLEKASPQFQEVIKAALARGDVGLKAPPAAVFGVEEKDRAWVDAKCTPHPTGTFLEKQVYTGARDKIAKKAYIRATTYPNPSFQAALVKTKANPAWKTYELNTGHDVMVTVPDRLTEILLEVA
jgi:pimeloyl-ACP methyl ester carboxylesterase